MKAHRLIIAVIISFALIGSTVACDATRGGAGGVVAVVNGENITEDEFTDVMETMFGEEALRTLMLYKMVMSAAESEGLAPSEEEVQGEIDEMREQFGDQGFAQFLSQYGMSEGSFRYNLGISMALDNIRFDEIDVSDEQLFEYFSENREQFDTQDEIRASHILVADEPSAWHMIDLLDEGGDFADLARMHSQDPGTAEQGGDLGYFGYDEMDPAFEDAAFATGVGEISDPVQSYAGFHVIKVTDRREGGPADFEDVKERVAESYRQENARSGQEVLNEIRSAASVDIQRPEYSDLWVQF